MRHYQALFLCLALNILSVDKLRGEKHAGKISTKADLDAAVTQLKNDRTRLDALAQLLSFASMKYYNRGGSVYFLIGDQETDMLMDQASAVIDDNRDFNTIRNAINSCSSTLQCWGLWHLPSFPREDALNEPLLARVRELANCSNAATRGEAQHCLWCLGGQAEFLTQCIEAETCPDNFMRLIYGNGSWQDRTECYKEMNKHLLRLLHDKQAKIRSEALSFIGSDSYRAEMWQIKFSREVFDQVLQLSRSEHSSDRNLSVSPLRELRNHDPDTVFKRLVQMARDNSENVRWQIPQALHDHRGQAEVESLLGALVKDRSPLVRYFTILEVGPKNYANELRELAQCKDKKVAGFAADKLRELKISLVP